MNRLTFKTRLVGSFGARFLPSGDADDDPSVALGRLSSFPARLGPVVVRVSSAGRAMPGDACVVGDWLCGDGPPRRLRGGPWDWGDATATAWSRRRGALESWESCARADWMAAEASSCGVDPRVVVAAVCDCVRLSARLLPDDRLSVLASVEAWASGGQDPPWPALAASVAPSSGGSLGGRREGRGDAAPLVALVALCRATPHHAPSLAQRAVSLSAPAAAGARGEVLSVMAAAVRGRVPAVVYLRALAARGPRGERGVSLPGRT